MRNPETTNRHRAGRPDAGFSLIEMLVANIVMAVAVLSFVHTIVAANKLNRATQDRALATVTLGRFLERMRADTSWHDLYTRLRQRSVESADDPGLSSLAVDTSLRTWPVTDYYPDLEVPASLGTVTFLVQVPITEVAGSPSLVESVEAPRYGLPHDLNSDGVIDSKPHNLDHTALPVVARVRWSRPGEQSHEVVLATWLREER